MSRRVPCTGAPLRGLVVLTCATLVATCDAPTVPLDPAYSPYEFRLVIPGDSLVFHWDVGSTVAVHILESAEPDRPSLRKAFRKGAELWNGAALTSEVRLVEGGEVARAEVVLRWSDDPSPVVPPGDCGGPVPGAASTQGCFVESLEEGGASVRPLLPWSDVDGGRTEVRMQVVVVAQRSTDQEITDLLVAHELGHVVGILNHSPDPDDLMWGGSLTALELSRADVLTLRALYQSSRDLVP